MLPTIKFAIFLTFLQYLGGVPEAWNQRGVFTQSIKKKKSLTPLRKISLNLQLIKILWLPVPSLDRPRQFQQPIGERWLPMIHVRNYREVPYPFDRVFAQIYRIFFVTLTRLGTKWSIENGSKNHTVSVEQVIEIRCWWSQCSIERDHWWLC